RGFDTWHPLPALAYRCGTHSRAAPGRRRGAGFRRGRVGLCNAARGDGGTHLEHPTPGGGFGALAFAVDVDGARARSMVVEPGASPVTPPSSTDPARTAACRYT